MSENMFLYKLINRGTFIVRTITEQVETMSYEPTNISRAHDHLNDLAAFNEDDFGGNEVTYGDFCSKFVPMIEKEASVDLPPFSVSDTHLDEFQRRESEIETAKFDTDPTESDH